MAAKKRTSKRSGLGVASEKDYNAIAKVLCEGGASEKIIDGISNHFKEFNHRFKPDLFKKVSMCKKGE